MHIGPQKMTPGTLRSVTSTRAYCNNVNLGMLMSAGIGLRYQLQCIIILELMLHANSH